MNNKKGILIGAVLCLCLTAVIAGGSRFIPSAEAEHPLLQVAQAAQEQPDSAHQEFQRLDINEDGVIDRIEANAVMKLSKQFSDLAGNEPLSREEYLSWVAEQPASTTTQ